MAIGIAYRANRRARVYEIVIPFKKNPGMSCFICRYTDRNVFVCPLCLSLIPYMLKSKNESESEVVQSCPTLCDPMDCSPPGSSVHGILQVSGKWVPRGDLLSDDKGSEHSALRGQAPRPLRRGSCGWNLLESSKLPLAARFTQTRKKAQREGLPGSGSSSLLQPGLLPTRRVRNPLL